METPTILITDAQSRQALAAARSLGRAGYRVLTADTERLTLGGASCFAVKSFTYPDPRADEAGFVAKLQQKILRERITMILPMADRSLVALARHAQEFGSVLLPFPNLQTVMMARDKSQTLELARSMGIPIPKSLLVRSIEEIPHIRTFPVLLKPIEGSGSRGIRIVASSANLHATASQVLAQFGPFLAQELIPHDGPEIGCYMLCDSSSRPVASLLQKRIRSFPARGGPSTLRTTFHDDHILTQSIEILRRIGWRGVAMVEWKVDPRDGIPKLMEINPRFWGSLEGSIAAGVDFPRLLSETFTGKPPTTPPPYPDGHLSRWFFPGDLLWLCTSGFSLKNLAAFLRSSFVHDDVWSFRDPMPFFASILISLRHLLHPRHRAYFLQR